MYLGNVSRVLGMAHVWGVLDTYHSTVWKKAIHRCVGKVGRGPGFALMPNLSGIHLVIQFVEVLRVAFSGFLSPVPGNN